MINNETALLRAAVLAKAEGKEYKNDTEMLEAYLERLLSDMSTEPQELGDTDVQ